MESILNLLPKIKEKKLHHYDATVHAFLMQLENCEDEKAILGVVDDMFVHYTNVLQLQHSQLEYFLRRSSMEDLTKMEEIKSIHNMPRPQE